MQRSNLRPNCRPAAGFVCLSILLVACDGMHARDAARLEASDATSIAARYPIGATLERTRLDVAGYVGHGPESSTAYFNATRFVRAYAQEGRGPLHIATPARGGQADVTLVRRVILASGVPSGQVRMRTRHDGIAAVTLSYDRMTAVAPDSCYDLSPLAERRPEIETGTAFGCATQRNLARMVADPTDLMVAAPEPDRGSDRRAALHKDYKDTIRQTPK